MCIICRLTGQAWQCLRCSSVTIMMPILHNEFSKINLKSRHHGCVQRCLSTVMIMDGGSGMTISNLYTHPTNSICMARLLRV